MKRQLFQGLVAMCAFGDALSVQAGTYTEPKVTVISVKSNQYGGCFLRYRYGPGSVTAGASWTCNSAYGVNMLNLAQMAFLTRNSVNLMLEGTGDDYKPLYAIEFNEN